MKKIETALISVFNKEGLEPVIQKLATLGVEIYSTGGTQKFIEDLGIPVESIENLTGYPSILGGRVKTLHPKVFGGILARGDQKEDAGQLDEFGIPTFDLVIVDLYPFEETLQSGATKEDIIEKIDIGGISLIRAAAKNFQYTLIISSRKQYSQLLSLLDTRDGGSDLEDRKNFATAAFDMSSHYDTVIFNYFNENKAINSFKSSFRQAARLRYGENPHQEAIFYGNLNELFDQLNGKDLSYNNLVDVDAAVSLLAEFAGQPTFLIIKHTIACGVARGSNTKDAYLKALECDPVSAFGGILATNSTVDQTAAEKIHKLFFEVIIAPEFAPEALQLLSEKKKRIILRQKKDLNSRESFKSLLTGVIKQDPDLKTEQAGELENVTDKKPTKEEINALLFANKIVKHTKSNAIVLSSADQLYASGTGQTSRVDALKQAIHKAKTFGFDLSKAVMASDAFFPFPDSVEIANKEGIKAVIQPGGSVKDQESIDYCNKNNMAMVFTGYRHFKH